MTPSVTYEDLEKSHVLVKKHGKVAVATLNRPQSLNAIVAPMHLALEELLLRVNDDHETNALVITGAGRGFCAGGDMKGPIHSPDPSKAAIADPMHLFRGARRLITRFLECHVPTVAAINGPAAGLGATIALLCDVTYMAQSATIGDTHTRVGLAAGDGGAVIWPWLVGAHKARELLMAGEMISAQEADRIGLVNHVVADEALFSAAMAYAEKLAGMMPWAVRATKMAVNRNIQLTAAASMDFALAAESLGTYLGDYREAVASYQQKRPGRYTGR